MSAISDWAFHAGMYLRGNTFDSTPQNTKVRDMNPCEDLYFRGSTHLLLTGAGIVIGGLGILALLASTGHISGLVAFASTQAAHTMKIVATVTISVGAATAGTHGAMVGLESYALHVLNDEQSDHHSILQ